MQGSSSVISLHLSSINDQTSVMHRDENGRIIIDDHITLSRWRHRSQQPQTTARQRPEAAPARISTSPSHPVTSLPISGGQDRSDSPLATRTPGPTQFSIVGIPPPVPPPLLLPAPPPVSPHLKLPTQASDIDYVPDSDGEASQVSGHQSPSQSQPSKPLQHQEAINSSASMMPPFSHVLHTSKLPTTLQPPPPTPPFLPTRTPDSDIEAFQTTNPLQLTRTNDVGRSAPSVTARASHIGQFQTPGSVLPPELSTDSDFEPSQEVLTSGEESSQKAKLGSQDSQGGRPTSANATPILPLLQESGSDSLLMIRPESSVSLNRSDPTLGTASSLGTTQRTLVDPVAKPRSKSPQASNTLSPPTCPGLDSESSAESSGSFPVLGSKSRLQSPQSHSPQPRTQTPATRLHASHSSMNQSQSPMQSSLPRMQSSQSRMQSSQARLQNSQSSLHRSQSSSHHSQSTMQQSQSSMHQSHSSVGTRTRPRRKVTLNIDDLEAAPNAPPRIRPNLVRSNANVSKHFLQSTERGESGVEILARKIERRRQDRIIVTGKLRAELVKECRQIAKRDGRSHQHRIHLDDLRSYRKQVLAAAVEYDAQKKTSRYIYHELFRNQRDHDVKLKVIDKAIQEMNEVEGEWFYYGDFIFYNTHVLPRGGLFTKSPTIGAIQFLFLYYFLSAVLFCRVLQDEAICPKDPTEQGRVYYGWLTTIYFACVTMSTVGYGDVNFAPNVHERWRVYIGTLFILASMVVGYTVFAAAGNATLKRFGDKSKMTKYLLNRLRYDGEHIPLHKQIRVIFFLRIAELVVLFMFFVSIGVFAARIAIRYSEEEAHQWSWMTTYYWAVQTVTTVGYGDVPMPFELRWFQIFYVTVGTALVGSVFAGVANLKTELNDLRRYYAWKRRQLSARLIEDMKGGNSCDNKIDQYEFLVGSLLTLNKINRKDVELIMDQFRQLAGDRGYISYSEAAHQGDGFDSDSQDFEFDFDAADEEEVLW